MPITLSMEDGATLELGGMTEYIGSAYSPQVDVTETDTGHEVAITYDDAEQGITTKTFDVADGHDGADGYSPTATVTQLADGATIRITDKDGTTTATVHDGADGHDGANGFSPTARVTQTATGATISITDKGGTTTATVSNGADGSDGSDGADGFSPTVDVQPIEGGHEVTITDAQGPHSFDVMDGDPAEPGSITDVMLAPDGIKAEVEWLCGNQLKGSTSGELMQASDAYGAPVLSLGVDGKSTQVTTTGKNLMSDVAAEWVLATLGGTSYRCTFVPVEAGASYLYHRASGSTTMSAGWVDGTDGSGFVAIASMSGHNLGYTFTNSDNHSYLVFYYASSTTAESAAGAMSSGKVQVEAGTSYSGYEKYSGRAASPRPDWPQPIVSVEGVVLQLQNGSNMLDTSAWVENKYIGPTGQIGGESGIHYTENFSHVMAGTYVFNIHRSSTNGSAVRLHGYDADKLWVRQIYSEVIDKGTTWYTKQNIVIDSDIKYVRVSCHSTMTELQLELGSTATAYKPFAGTAVSIDLTEHPLRSLPDGTHDELNLTYLRPSTTAGWAWYARELVTRIDRIDYDAASYMGNNASGYLYLEKRLPSAERKYVDVYTSAGSNLRGLSNRFKAAQSSSNYLQPNNFVYYNPNGGISIGFAAGTFADLAEANAWLANNETYLLLKRRNADIITTQLDPIELPVLPAPTCTVWADPTTGLQMEYVQDTNIVIASLQAALADLATS